MSAAEFAERFEEARRLHAQGKIAEAEDAYRQLAGSGEQREIVLRALVELYLHSGRLTDAIAAMVELTHVVPDRLYYFARLAALLEGRGEIGQAIGHYQRLLLNNPALAPAHFNLALLYKKDRRFAEALASYQEALRLGIDGVEEVYSNLGVLYSETRRQVQALEMYQRALDAKPDYLPALFNLAGLFEESGRRQEAIALYERILTIESRHWEALARLVHAKTLTAGEEPLLDRLRRALSEAGEDRAAREGLYFALGKGLDDLGRYDEAFAAYRSANELGALRSPGYDRRTVEQVFDRIISVFSREWLRKVSAVSASCPIFICGMFRSGSTLVEQILGSHPSITPGGELECLPWLVERRLTPFPDRLSSVSRAEVEELGRAYASCVEMLFPGVLNVTDKRPDNFVYLGLVKAMFPAARVVYTKRNPVDNYLSIYFQQLGGNLGYATDLDDIAHYYQQHVRLMTHWIQCFGQNIFTVDYDELVASPEPLLRRLLEFLEIEWDERCLTFRDAGNLVKTASVWQVREALYSHSSGRWKNYAHHLRGLRGAASGDRT